MHAAAIIKALEKGDRDLADRVYSGVPAHVFGRSQEIGIGPMSGASNVTHWLKSHGIPVSEAVVKAILARAKQSHQLLSDEDIRGVLAATPA